MKQQLLKNAGKQYCPNHSIHLAICDVLYKKLMLQREELNNFNIYDESFENELVDFSDVNFEINNDDNKIEPEISANILESIKGIRQRSCHMMFN